MLNATTDVLEYVMCAIHQRINSVSVPM